MSRDWKFIKSRWNSLERFLSSSSASVKAPHNAAAAPDDVDVDGDKLHAW